MNADDKPSATEVKPAAEPPKAGALSTYEECKDAIVAAKAGGPEACTNVITQLEAFFDKRLKKKASMDEKEGVGAVKRAVEASRTFKKYESPATKHDEAAKPGGGLFA